MKNVHWKVPLITVLVSCPFGGILAETYKCVENGKTTYQATPCLGAGATVSVKPPTGNASSSAPSTASDKSEPPEQDPLAKTKENVRLMELEHKQREIGYEIQTLEAEIAQYQVGLDRDLAALRRQKAKATNSLAGATYEESISSEMQAVTERYKADIQVDQDKLSQLRSEQAELKKSH